MTLHVTTPAHGEAHPPEGILQIFAFDNGITPHPPRGDLDASHIATSGSLMQIWWNGRAVVQNLIVIIWFI
jgi:hypothetical protein